MAARPQDRGIQETTLGSAAVFLILAAHNDLERIVRQRTQLNLGHNLGWDDGSACKACRSDRYCNVRATA